jgi:hypothetical protein
MHCVANGGRRNAARGSLAAKSLTGKPRRTDHQDRPCERAESASKRSSAEGAVAPGARSPNAMQRFAVTIPKGIGAVRSAIDKQATESID